jgi:phage tail tape-measure protein
MIALRHELWRWLMHRHMKYALVAVALMLPNLALAETGGAAAGAAAGGAAGAVVGGPVGAAVGAGVGGVVGGAASGPDQRNVTIEHRNVESTGSVGCTTTTKQRTDAFGDTTTKQKTEC